MTSLTRRPKGNTRVTGKEQYYTPRSLATELVAEVAALVPQTARAAAAHAATTSAVVDVPAAASRQ
jgi:hypothetical protein